MTLIHANSGDPRVGSNRRKKDVTGVGIHSTFDGTQHAIFYQCDDETLATQVLNLSSFNHSFRTLAVCDSPSFFSGYANCDRVRVITRCCWILILWILFWKLYVVNVFICVWLYCKVHESFCWWPTEGTFFYSRHSCGFVLSIDGGNNAATV